MPFQRPHESIPLTRCRSEPVKLLLRFSLRHPQRHGPRRGRIAVSCRPAHKSRIAGETAEKFTVKFHEGSDSISFKDSRRFHPPGGKRAVEPAHRSHRGEPVLMAADSDGRRYIVPCRIIDPGAAGLNIRGSVAVAGFRVGTAWSRCIDYTNIGIAPENRCCRQAVRPAPTGPMMQEKSGSVTPAGQESGIRPSSSTGGYLQVRAWRIELPGQRPSRGTAMRRGRGKAGQSA